MNAYTVVNNQFLSQSVRLNTEEGSSIVLTDYALKLAEEQDLDLVVISAQAEPPVVKIMNYSKYMFEQNKAEKAKKKANRQNAVEIKEIQLRPVTDVHDIKVKAKKARKFLDDGDKVKVVIRFKGREQSHTDLGYKVIENFLKEVGTHSIDTAVAYNGRALSVTIAA